MSKIWLICRLVYMIFSAQWNDIDRVEYLLGNGVPVDIRDHAGYTALHYAARNGHYQICVKLLLHKADINSRTNCGGTTALHRAAMMGHTDIVKLLLKFGADPNILDADGNTPLHKAILSSPNMESIRELISITDLTILNRSGKSVEQLATQRKFFDLLPQIKGCGTNTCVAVNQSESNTD